jgi:hypothetical protein
MVARERFELSPSVYKRAFAGKLVLKSLPRRHFNTRYEDKDKRAVRLNGNLYNLLLPFLEDAKRKNDGSQENACS